MRLEESFIAVYFRDARLGPCSGTLHRRRNRNPWVRTCGRNTACKTLDLHARPRSLTPTSFCTSLDERNNYKLNKKTDCNAQSHV